jgi:uncharacterized protein (DUF2141 family)
VAKKKLKRKNKASKKNNSNFFLKLFFLPIIAVIVILIGYTVVNASMLFATGSTISSAVNGTSVSLTAKGSGSSKTVWVMFHVKKENEEPVQYTSKVLSSEWISIKSGQKITYTFSNLPKSKYVWTIRAAVQDSNHNWTYAKGATFWPGSSETTFAKPSRFTIGTSPTVSDFRSKINGNSVGLSVVTKNNVGKVMFTMFFVKKVGETSSSKIRKSEWISSRSGDTLSYTFNSLEKGKYAWTVRANIEGVDLQGVAFPPYSAGFKFFAPSKYFTIK